MSATTGIPSGTLWGREPAPPWSDRVRGRTTPVAQETGDHGPPEWIASLGLLIMSIVFAILSLPLIAIGAITAAVIAAWSILLPALIAGFVIVIVSLVVAGL